MVMKILKELGGSAWLNQLVRMIGERTGVAKATGYRAVNKAIDYGMISIYETGPIRYIKIQDSSVKYYQARMFRLIQM